MAEANKDPGWACQKVISSSSSREYGGAHHSSASSYINTKTPFPYEIHAPVFLPLPGIRGGSCLTIKPHVAATGQGRKPSTPIQFVDVTAAAGIKWNLKVLAPGAKYLIETMGGGGGFIDYNGDGLLDIYLVCYSQAPQPDGASKLKDVLYRNNGDGTFTDVTDSAGYRE